MYTIQHWYWYYQVSLALYIRVESINTSTVTNLPSPYIHYKQHCCVYCVGNHAGNMRDVGEGMKTLYYYIQYVCEVHYRPSINGLSRNFSSRSECNLTSSLIDCHYSNTILCDGIIKHVCSAMFMSAMQYL